MTPFDVLMKTTKATTTTTTTTTFIRTHSMRELNKNNTKLELSDSKVTKTNKMI